MLMAAEAPLGSSVRDCPSAIAYDHVQFRFVWEFGYAAESFGHTPQREQQSLFIPIFVVNKRQVLQSHMEVRGRAKNNVAV